MSTLKDMDVLIAIQARDAALGYSCDVCGGQRTNKGSEGLQCALRCTLGRTSGGWLYTVRRWVQFRRKLTSFGATSHSISLGWATT